MELIVEKSGAVTTLIINRVEVYNALNTSLLEALKDAIEAANTDPETKVVILTANGPAFCSGADLKEGIQGSAKDALEKRYNPIVQGISQSSKPYICALNGMAVGAGMSLVMACDLVYAAPAAYFSLKFIDIALMPDAGVNYFLVKKIGYARALELALSARKVSMEEAQNMGIITAQTDDYLTMAQQMAEKIAQGPTHAIAAIKQTMQLAQNGTLAEVLKAEAQHQDALVKTRDFAEGVTAFIQKRKPNFVGR